MKYNVGDKVRIREWEDMAEEFGVDSSGNICNSFVTSMKKYCGEILTVKTRGGEYTMKEDNGKWTWNDSMIERKIGTFKSYELLKLIDEKPKQIAGKKFKLIKDDTCRLNTGVVAQVRTDGLFDGNFKINISGFEEWEEVIEEPMMFNELLDKLKNTSGRIKVEHGLLKSDIEYLYLDEVLFYLSNNYAIADIIEILKNGKFYIKN